MLSSLKQMANELMQKGTVLFNRTLDQTLFNRVVMAAYLIASADGDFDADERKALVKLINKDLPDFNINDISKVIANCEEKVTFDKTLGIQQIINEIALSAPKSADSRQIMAVCAFIGAADGTYDKDEKLMARSIAYALKLNPAEFGC